MYKFPFGTYTDSSGPFYSFGVVLVVRVSLYSVTSPICPDSSFCRRFGSPIKQSHRFYSLVQFYPTALLGVLPVVLSPTYTPGFIRPTTDQTNGQTLVVLPLMFSSGRNVVQKCVVPPSPRLSHLCNVPVIHSGPGCSSSTGAP